MAVNGKDVRSSHEVFEAVNGASARLSVTMLHKAQHSHHYERVTVTVQPIDNNTPSGFW